MSGASTAAASASGFAEKAFDAPSIVPAVPTVSNKAVLPAAWRAY